MPELQFPNIVGNYQNALSFGRQLRAEDVARQNQSRLSELAAQAYGATSPQDQRGFVQQAIGVDPTAGMALGESLAKQDDRQTQELVRAARFMKAAPAEQKQAAWQQVRGSLAQRFPQMQLPEAYDASVDETVNALDAAYGPGGQAEGYTLSPGARRFDASGRLIAEAPFAPDRPQNAVFQVDQQGNGWWLTPGQPPQRADMPGQAGGAAPTPLPMASGRQATDAEDATRIEAMNAYTQRLRDAGFTPEQIQAAQLAYEPFVFGQQGPQSVDAPQAQPAAGGINFGKPDKGPDETFSNPQPVTDPATGKTVLVQFGNRGGRRVVGDYSPPPTSRETKPPSVSEQNAAGYLSRMESAERELESVVASGYDPGNLRDQYTAGRGLLNFAASNLGQQYRQQQEDWVRAKLRKESGAVIGDDEMQREIEVYFPQPGDGKEVIANKAKSRAVAIGAMRKSAGRAADDAGQPGGAGGGASPREITSQAEFDALPSGAIYLENGQQYRKP